MTSRKTIVEFDAQSVELFNALKRLLKGSNPRDVTNKEAFLVALGYGFHHASKVAEVKRSGTGVRTEYWNDRDQLLMAAIQLFDSGKVESLEDLDQRYEVAERYAQGGILLLKDLLEREHSFAQEFAGEVLELLPRRDPEF